MTQVATFIQLDKLFDLSQPSEYVLGVSRSIRVPHGRNVTNIFSGKAKFRIVAELSPAEIAATNAFAQELGELRKKARQARNTAARNVK